MPRMARLDVLGVVQHVMARGIEGAAIFRDEKDRETFLAKLAGVVQDGEAQLLGVGAPQGPRAGQGGAAPFKGGRSPSPPGRSKRVSMPPGGFRKPPPNEIMGLRFRPPRYVPKSPKRRPGACRFVAGSPCDELLAFLDEGTGEGPHRGPVAPARPRADRPPRLGTGPAGSRTRPSGTTRAIGACCGPWCR